MTNYTFTGNDDNVRPEQIKDTDLTHDSPHHTLGRGHTQAAPGNHTHKYSDLVETPGDTTGLYVKTIGDNMSGKLQINTPDGLTLHSPGDAIVSMQARYVDGRYTLFITDYLPGGVGSLAPVQVGTPVNGNSAATVQWTLDWAISNLAMQLSGPHGPIHAGYVNVPNGDVPSAGLWFPAKSVTGVWKLTASCYGYLVTASNANIYTGFRFRWEDGLDGSYRNDCFQQASRLHCNAAMGSNRGALNFVAFIDGRPGLNLGVQLQASYDGTPSVAQIGLIRMTAEFYPSSQELGLASGWTDIW